MKFNYPLVLLSVALLSLSGCGSDQGTLVEDYLEYVADKDIEGITDSMSVADAKSVNQRVSSCLSDMSNEKKKLQKIKKKMGSYLMEIGMSRRDEKKLNIQRRHYEKGQPLDKRYPSLDTFMKDYSRGLDEAGKGLLHLVIFENNKKYDKNTNVGSYWFNEYFTDESFCQSEVIDNLSYDDINIIEVQEKSADSVNVRFEIIADDGSSDKTSIDVEKINGEWKIVGQPYIISSFGW
ncbi:MAG: hypothetical protein COA44_15865 [Arcobacter sp.]|nr:MAG: hypothetical protein COA44_15865 [Arcobacter sp.]